MSLGTAEYEAFYNGTWRDIESDYSYDTTKAGNTIARCKRFDDGYRSYREDRGLIIRKKGEDEDEEDYQTQDSDIVDTAGTFGKSFAMSAGVGFVAKSFEKVFGAPETAKTSLGSFLGKNKVTLAFTAYNLFQDTGQSTGEKLGQAALSIAVGTMLSKFGGPAAPFVIPAIQIVKGLLQDETPINIAAKVTGSYLGKKAGKGATDVLFKGGKAPVSENIFSKEVEKAAATRMRDDIFTKSAKPINIEGLAKKAGRYADYAKDPSKIPTRTINVTGKKPSQIAKTAFNYAKRAKRAK